MKSLIKSTLPPFVLNAAKSFFNKGIWSGNYLSWEEAKKDSIGYDCDEILQKVKTSTKKIISGHAKFERDSVLFHKMEWNFPLLSSLFFVASKQNNSLNVVDVGGSLGSLYHQYKSYFAHMTKMNWTVVEQSHFVEEGVLHFQNQHLNFSTDLKGSIDSTQTVVLLSGVLQYVENPQSLLNQIISHKPKYLLIDRTSFNAEPKDRLTIQSVPKEIYPASYPCWFFNEEKFKISISNEYDLIWEFDSFDKADIPSKFKGYLFERK